MPYKDQLSTTFYDKTFPKALTTIKSSIRAAVSRNPRNAGLLIRLGCDASLLLEGEGSEKRSPANNGVLGYEIIDAAKAAVERVCPGVVSCANILAVAARDASVTVKGPSWLVRLGRRDSTTFNATQAASDLPRGDFNLSRLIDNFQQHNALCLSEASVGSHTIGLARCVTFRARIYNNASNIDAAFASSLRENCPPTSPDGNNNTRPLDLITPNRFDNNYFRNLVRTMVKMSEIDLLTGDNGVIRTLCNTTAS
ncbi:hypothetical protein L1987_12210 [Smallanthus sonchifolius]|uniref:Uncharacterized protein n=1 Tax=Smallanthus sonchifolius TaxID=185202 RepID=A0ACB9JDZ4_9ASTR|nr:hypothetical protein L1987_12210 [Smallanthus sonchifolius]